MLRFLRSSTATVTLAVLAAFSGSAQADFPKDLLAKHPCLKEVQSPWDDPMPTSKLPEAFKDWDNVYVGYWNGMNGISTFCSAFLLTRVNGDGSRVEAVYTNARPFKSEHSMVGKFMTVDGKPALWIGKNDWWIQYVRNEDGTLSMTSWTPSATGLMYPANKSDKAVSINQ